MLSKIIRKFLSTKAPIYSNSGQKREEALFFHLQLNLKTVKDYFDHAPDLVIRELSVGVFNVNAALIYLEGLTDKEMVNEHLIKSLIMEERFNYLSTAKKPTDLLNFIKKSSISVAAIDEAKTFAAVVDGIVNGKTALFLEGYNTALLVNTRGHEKRPISEPDTEIVVRGSREGFTESLNINISLLRRRLKNPNLQLENYTIGRQSKTMVCLAYLKNVAHPELIEEIKKRLQRIDIDAILESGYIEQLIEDTPYSIFPTVGNTEKPDVLAAKLLEGRVAVLVDGTPFALTVPYLFIEAFQVAEDYYSRPFYVTLIRWLRFTSFMFATSLPGFYVAVETFHQEVIPSTLLPLLASSKEGTPFPAIVEALIMGIIFEILREAGVRLPRAVGAAISIVGALVIGEAAVAAGLIGAPMVITVALTAITSFIVPSLGDAIALIRLFITILAGFMGMFGIIWGYTAILLHLCSLSSLGVPYLAPLAPMVTRDLKDVLFRAPLWAMLTRPAFIGRLNQKRQNAVSQLQREVKP